MPKLPFEGPKISFDVLAVWLDNLAMEFKLGLRQPVLLLGEIVVWFEDCLELFEICWYPLRLFT